jgi:transcriptional regulator with XRE-family HTH domain
MNGHLCDQSMALSSKIAALVRERGWSQKEFARRAGLSRQTIREILEQTCRRRLRNRTIFGCARALGMCVSQLCQEDCTPGPSVAEEGLMPMLTEDLRYDLATQPQVKRWLEERKNEAGKYTQAEVTELLSMQGTGGPLTADGLRVALEQLDRKRKLFDRVHVVAGTEYLGLLERLVEWLYERVQPYGNAG